MLAKLVLENFRCFRKHEIPLGEKTIIVGRNNAGKSTIIEALRLIAIVAERYEFVPYSPPPRWLELHKSIRGIAPSLDNQAFNFEKVFHRYNDPPAVVTASFTGGATITVYVGPKNAIYAVLRNNRRVVVTSKGQALSLDLPTIGILPQVAPLRQTERALEPEYVRHCISSTLAPLHFRNQLQLLRNEFFDEFKKISESTWHGLVIAELKSARFRGEQIIELLVRNEDFVAEVSWMGHGLQMWLQTMWFLARSSDCDTVILDEPNVYMHADLQRRLIRLLRDRHPQVIIATHSIEIMAEVEPEEILVVDRDKSQARFASDLPEVQQIVSHIGGVHNLQLARLVSSQKCLFIEGDDLGILKRFHNLLFPKSDWPIDVIPHVSIGGWGGWTYVIGSAMWLAGNMGEVSIYCVLDSDYHTPEQVEGRIQEARSKGINLRIWSKKELENYLLVPTVVHRTMARLMRGGAAVPSLEEVSRKMEAFAESLWQDTVDCLAEEIALGNRKLALKTVNAMARTYLANSWNSLEAKLSRVSGKELLVRLNTWAQKEFKISFTTARLASQFREGEVYPEIRDFLSAMEFKDPL